MNQAARIVIVGGGYAGVLAANRLAGRAPRGTEIRLVSPGDTFINRIRLHEAAARGTKVQLQLRSLLSPRVAHVDAKLLRVDSGASTLVIERDGAVETLVYDHAILALGSTPSATSGPADFDAVSSPAAAARFHSRLCALPAGARVVIVGGGLTAVELVTEVAQARPDLRTSLVAHRLLPDVHGEARSALLEALAALGIQVTLGRRANAGADGQLVLDDGSTMGADLCAVCDGFRVSPRVRELGLPTQDDGRIRVDDSLRVEGSTNLFAVGDIAMPPAWTIGTGLSATRMGCSTAMPMGAHAADEIARALRHQQPVPHAFAYAIRCISLGRRRGLVLVTDGDDRPGPRYFSGSIGAMIKEFICRMVIGAIRFEAYWSGVYSWPRPSRRVDGRA